MKAKSAFTLIELMLVVIIIGVLGAMVLPRLAGRSEQAKAAVAKSDINANIATALDLYELDNGRYPTTEQGLAALTTKPGDLSEGANWNGPYLKKEPKDPWGKDYQYKYPSTHEGVDYDLYSLGADGIESDDDIGNWKK
ncbi:MAG: type II secretion system major pseudopilin GspG [Candidatus Omnitrophica bacterium]|nr:type II secretion system major pseudopilin GspG [Candidatus Omnitrophota bacterium]